MITLAGKINGMEHYCKMKCSDHEVDNKKVGHLKMMNVSCASQRAQIGQFNGESYGIK